MSDSTGRERLRSAVHEWNFSRKKHQRWIPVECSRKGFRRPSASVKNGHFADAPLFVLRVHHPRQLLAIKTIWRFRVVPELGVPAINLLFDDLPR